MTLLIVNLLQLCMLYKIGCNPMHPLDGALPGPYVPVRITRGTLVSHRYTYPPPRCKILQYRSSFVLLSDLLGRFCRPRIRWCGTGGFQEQCQCFFIRLSCSIPTIEQLRPSTIFPFLFFLYIGWLHCRLILILIINNIFFT